ncbi:MAG: hypothetical protein ACRD6X_15590, partial [Pyrinomonadaceae bacterium]
MTIANKSAFVLLCTALIFTAVAYGGVHQPVIAIFYILVTLAGIAWAIDGWDSGGLHFSKEMLQLPLIGTAVYAFIQLVPFGSLAAIAGLEGIPNTISQDSFATWSTALQFVALTVFFVVLLYCLNSSGRIKRLYTIVTVFAFPYSFFAILQSIISPQKIYGIYDVVSGSAYG